MKMHKNIQIEEVYEFSVDRYDYVIEFLNRYLKKEIKLIEIGCGPGNIIEYVGSKTNIQKLYGIDVSTKALELAQKRGIKVFRGSIVNSDFVSSIDEEFECVILGAILHHLAGKTRSLSKIQAYRAVKNSLLLLKSGGYLFTMEPIFEPYFIGSLIFYIKKFINTFTSKRISIFGYWNNIGAPITSYFSRNSLIELVNYFKDLEIVDIYEKELQRNFLMKLFFIRKRADLTLILRKK